MAIDGYFDVFPEKAGTELRTATFEEGRTGDPLAGGMFIFTEYFCTDLDCDCQRVLVKVLRATSEDTAPEEVATISYTWNSGSDDSWRAVNLEVPNPFLDPLHRQAHYAGELLDFWSTMIERDKDYALRLQRHYDEIRSRIGETDEWGEQPRGIERHSHKPPPGPMSRRQRNAQKRRLARARKGK